jgi:RsiW-degrading membrane proteinase PrsW (M82 family)
MTLAVSSPIARAVRGLLLVALVLAMLLTLFAVLAVAGLETGAPAFVLALLLATAPVPIYLALVLWIDRFEPEPLKMIALTFFWGASIAAFVAVVLNTVGEAVVSEQLGAEVGQLYGYSISAPIVEEGIKAAVLFGLFLFFRREFNGVIDGIVYAGCVGLGFAMTENVLYYGRGAAEEGVVGAVGTFVVRGLMSPVRPPGLHGDDRHRAGHRRLDALAHAARRRPIAGLLLAMFLHSLWNTSAWLGPLPRRLRADHGPVFLALGVVVWWALQAREQDDRHPSARHPARGRGPRAVLRCRSGGAGGREAARRAASRPRRR